MKFFTGCVAAATLALATAAAQRPALAQVPSVSARGVIAVSDLDEPYAPPPRYGYEDGYGPGGPAPVLLPATEVYAVLRDNGFSPLGIPRLRGHVYTIAAIDRRGDDGRLVIDARDGRIVRFQRAVDAYGMAPVIEEPAIGRDGPQTALPLPTVVRGGPPRPPAPIPHVASRTVPLPKAAPRRGEAPVAAMPATPPTAQAQAAQQTAAAQPKPAEAAPQAPAPTVGQAKSAPTILPTQEMPAVQGLE